MDRDGVYNFWYCTCGEKNFCSDEKCPKCGKQNIDKTYNPCAHCQLKTKKENFNAKY